MIRDVKNEKVIEKKRQREGCERKSRKEAKETRMNFSRGRKRDKEEVDERGERDKESEGRKKVKWDKQAGSHPESWKQTGTGGRVQ